MSTRKNKMPSLKPENGTKKLLLLLLFFVDLHAGFISPKVNFNICYVSLFPSNQRMYDATRFYYDSDGRSRTIDTLVPISNYVKWMPGYSIDGKFGECSFFNLGIKLKFEHLFNNRTDTYYDESRLTYFSIPIHIDLFNFQGGLTSYFNISDKLAIEPEVNFLELF